MSLQQVVEEKQTTESKWKEERLRRIKTEKRLRLAEDSLRRLDRALKESGVQIDLQIETDVKNLKSQSFFDIVIIVINPRKRVEDMFIGWCNVIPRGKYWLVLTENKHLEVITVELPNNIGTRH